MQAGLQAGGSQLLAWHAQHSNTHPSGLLQTTQACMAAAAQRAAPASCPAAAQEQPGNDTHPQAVSCCGCCAPGVRVWRRRWLQRQACCMGGRTRQRARPPLLTPARPALPCSQAPPRQQHTGEYRDEVHTEGDMTGYAVGEYGYKYRLLEGVVMPP